MKLIAMHCTYSNEMSFNSIFYKTLILIIEKIKAISQVELE
jgi:hypothetical protein